MPKTNHIKTPAADQTTLRGIGKLGYSEGSRMHSTIKSLTASMDNGEVRSTPGKKDKVKCPGCGQSFKSNSGKIPKHKPRWSWITTHDGYCSQSKGMYAEPVIVGKAESVVINTFEIRKGDDVAFTTYPWKVEFQDWNELKEYKIIELYIMDNERIYLDIGIKAPSGKFGKMEPRYIPASMFARNFIKL